MKRIEPWNRRNARIERGNDATAAPETMSSATDIGIATSGRRITRALARMSCALSHDFAEQTLRPEDEDEDQDREREDVLVLRAERAAGEEREVGRRERFEQAEHEPAEHRAWYIADAAEYCCRKCLQPGNEAGVGVDEAVLHAEQHARRAAH